MAGITYYGYMTLTHDPTIFVSFGIFTSLNAGYLALDALAVKINKQ